MASVNERAAEVMEHLCSDPSHGYSQYNRGGIGTGGDVAETITLSDGTRVGISYGDRDCSSAAIECYAALGVDCGGASYTGNMRGCMTKTGNFTWVTDLSQRQRGDILLNEAHHTAVYLGDGKLGQFSISENGTIHGQRGDQTGYESNVKAYYDYPWDGIIRYVGPDSDSHDVIQPPFQATSGQIEVDGYWGSATTYKGQVEGGTVADGYVDGQDSGWRGNLKGCTTGWRWCSGKAVTGSPHIRRVQTALRDKWRQDPGTIDGIFGMKTWQAMERAAGYKADSGFDAPSNTVKWYQTKLNEGAFF